MAGLILLGLLLLVTSIWTLVRINRSSTPMAVGCFFFFPLALLPLVDNWGKRDLDIRVPFFLTIVLYAAWIHQVLAIWQEFSAIYETDLELAEWQPLDETELRILQRQIVSDLTLHRGSVELAPVPAALDVPDHFRFVDAEDTRDLVQAFGFDPADETIGLLVHESVDLIDSPSPWVVWVGWYPDGHLAWGKMDEDPELTEALAAMYAGKLSNLDEADGYVPYELVELAVHPQYDVEPGIVAWAERYRYLDNGEELLDCVAARPGRRGLLLFVASDMYPQDEELCFRSARLMAQRTSYRDNHRHRDVRFFDPDSKFDVFDVVTGRYFVESVPVN